MKLFQKLLLAPAALGLLAPVAANAADVNIAGLSQYGTEEQVSETLPSLVSDAALFIWPGLASFHCPTWGPSLDSRLYVGG